MGHCGVVGKAAACESAPSASEPNTQQPSGKAEWAAC